MISRQRPDDGASRLRLPVLPAAIALLDAVLLLFSVGIWLTQQVPFSHLIEAYLLGDLTIGTGFAVGGALITLRVRRNAVGWLMLLAGTLYLVATALGTLLYLRLDSGDVGTGSRVLAAVFTTVWMPAIALCMPLALQLFPTGRPINRFGSVYFAVSFVGGVAITLSWILGPDLFDGMGLPGADTLVPAGPPGWLDAVLRVLTPLGLVTILGALLTPLFRLVRRPGEERLQVLWLVWAALVVLAVNAPANLGGVPAPVPLLVIPLIPLAMTAAVLKYRLYGITLVINRTVVYLALTLTLLGVYLVVVYGLSRLISGTGVRNVLATGAVAVAFSPLRALLQRVVDRLMLGPAPTRTARSPTSAGGCTRRCRRTRCSPPSPPPWPGR